jgi:hypothetical protein
MPVAAPDEATLDFYRNGMASLEAAGVEYLVGGAYALAQHAGIERHTRDFDVFVRPEDAEGALAALSRCCDRTEMTFTHWIGKAFCGDAYVDVIFNSGNGLSPVDDDWFANAVSSTVLGHEVRLIPPEEMIWQKAFIMERERFDGADIIHVLRTSALRLDWARLLRRFRGHWRVLFAHLVLFGYVYPHERHKIPEGVIHLLAERLQREAKVGPNGAGQKLLQGTLISREQYLVDLEEWGYEDARLHPSVDISEEEIAEWTAAIASR